MGRCSYCGGSAGFLRSAHAECKQSAAAAQTQIEHAALRFAVGGGDGRAMPDEVGALASAGRVRPEVLRSTLVSVFETAVDQALDDGVLSADEESNLMRYRETFSLTQDELDRNRAYMRVVEAAVLRDVLEGKLPDRVKLDGVHFNFQKSESLVWAFPNAEYYEERTRREYVGRSSGVRIKLMKGVYYSTSAFRGHPVERQELVHVDSGCLAVTNKHIYFGGGGRKAFRISFKKIVSFTPFDDGLGVMREAETAKPQIFEVGDGWFVYNLVTNLAEMAS